MRRIAVTMVLLALGLGGAPSARAQSTDAGGSAGTSGGGPAGDAASGSAASGGDAAGDPGGGSSGGSSPAATSTGRTGSASSGASATSSGGTSSSGGGSSSSGGSDAPAASSVRTYDGRPIVVVEADDDEPPPPEGDGRDVDFLYIELEGGYANVNLIAFQGESAFRDPAAMAFSEVISQGGYGGLGVGFRVYWIAIGARAAVAAHQGFQLGWVGGEATLRFPIPVVEPYIRAGFSYAWQGEATVSYPNAMSMTGVTVRDTTVYGWAFNAAVGLDIYLTNWFTIGGGAGFDLLNMSRQTDPTAMCMAVTDVCPSRPGDAVGYNIRAYGQIGFRF